MPDFTVIRGGGPEGRDRIRVEQGFEFVLREAHVLRKRDAVEKGTTRLRSLFGCGIVT